MKKRKTLRFKFILGFLLVALIGFILISTLASDAVSLVLTRIHAAELYEQAQTIASECSADENGQIQPLTYRQLGYDGLARGLNAIIWITDADSHIVYDSTDRDTGKRIDAFDSSSFGNKGNTAFGFCETGTFYHMLPAEHLSVMATIHLDYHTRGYVFIHLPVSIIDMQLYDILNLLYLSAVILWVLSLLLLIIYHFCVARPLDEIIKAADEYASGNLQYRCPVHSDDELGYLSATLNYMASELNNTEEYQRKFISNVSHDFRSPLTSIRGYLIAILDGTIPPELYEKYLNIVIRETDRLKKLTEGLLTLNQLGPGAAAGLNLTSFDINQTIKDTCATFEGACRSKNLVFELRFSDKVTIVRGDFVKIQQVIYNLIDNAIKFSNSSSSIDIETYDRNGKVFVSVKDHGCGIAKEQQKKIFERFYKADSSRGKDKQGTGLGLSITKEIIHAHKQTIDVISTPGVGTEFIFTLPME